MLALTGLVGWLGLSSLGASNSALKGIVDSEEAALSATRDGRLSTIRIQRDLRQLLLVDDAAAIKVAQASVADSDTTVNASVQTLKRLLYLPEGQKRLNAFEKAYSDWR